MELVFRGYIVGKQKGRIGHDAMTKEKQRKPAVFLDRDGVLSEEKSYICRLEDFTLFPYTKECIRQIKEKGYYVIVITNQSGVARGLFSEEVLQEMNSCLMKETGVDAVYYCSHHPKGKVEAYRKECNCRKPLTGMIEQACRDFSIDMTKSYMVGDRASDILLGQNAGLKTILVESGYGTKRLEQEVTPDYIMQDLRKVIGIL